MKVIAQLDKEDYDRLFEMASKNEAEIKRLSAGPYDAVIKILKEHPATRPGALADWFVRHRAAYLEGSQIENYILTKLQMGPTMEDFKKNPDPNKRIG